MSLVLLLIAFQPWRMSRPLAQLTRVFAAISVLSIEMQVVTWLQIGSIHSLPAVNLVVALLALVAWRPARKPEPRAEGHDDMPPAAALVLGAVVLALNLMLPLEAADPYHLDKIERIERTGTLAYDPNAEPKINVLSSVYEMLLADLRQIPVVGPVAIRLHGVWGLLLYLLAIGAVRELLGDDDAGGTRSSSAPRWPWVAMLVVPALFHQLVLVKNDLIVAVPALVTLVWIVTRSRTASAPDIVRMSWLAGFAVAVKLTTLPLLLVLGGSLVVQRGREWRALAAAALGTVIGMVAGGLFFTLAANVAVYGRLMPAGDQGNVNAGLAEVMTGLWRFAISLGDLGLVTRAWWPGRGGWGGTFGLPLLWSCAVLVWSRHLPVARAALLCAGVYFLAFAAVFPDADLSHRLALAPALLLISVAVWVARRGEAFRSWRLALVPTALLSGAQVARSASLYFMR